MSNTESLEELTACSERAFQACTEAIRALVEIRSRIAVPVMEQRKKTLPVDAEVLALLAGGKKTLGQISKEMSVPRWKVQNSMGRLVARGLAKLHRSGRGFAVVSRGNDGEDNA